MATESSISSFVNRLRGQRAAIPGGSRRDFFGDRVVIRDNVVPIAPSADCPSCSMTVTGYATSCGHCGTLLIRASA